MNTALWIVQGLLALAFIGAGLLKLLMPYERLSKMMTWTHGFAPYMVRGIGLLEVLGAIGLIAPAVTGILPILVPIAAACLVLTMVGAMITHIRIGETTKIAPNIVLMLLAAFVAVGRFAVVPLT
jgi:hypothetical protein